MKRWEVKHAQYINSVTNNLFRANNEAWISEGGFLVANVYHGAMFPGNDQMTRKAVDENAYLMAAAPELLKALERLVSVFYESGMYDDEVFAEAREAIASTKVENKQVQYLKERGYL